MNSANISYEGSELIIMKEKPLPVSGTPPYEQRARTRRARSRAFSIFCVSKPVFFIHLVLVVLTIVIIQSFRIFVTDLHTQMDCTLASSRTKAYSRYKCALVPGPYTDIVHQQARNRNLYRNRRIYGEQSLVK